MRTYIPYTYEAYIEIYTRPELLYDEYKRTGERKVRQTPPTSIAVVVHKNGRLVGCHSKFIGNSDKDLSNMIALLIACHVVHREKGKRVAFYTSDESLVETLRFGSKNRNKLHVGLLREIKASLSKFQRFDVRHIDIKQNVNAKREASLVFKSK